MQRIKLLVLSLMTSMSACSTMTTETQTAPAITPIQETRVTSAVSENHKLEIFFDEKLVLEQDLTPVPGFDTQSTYQATNGNTMVCVRWSGFDPLAHTDCQLMVEQEQLCEFSFWLDEELLPTEEAIHVLVKRNRTPS